MGGKHGERRKEAGNGMETEKQGRMMEQEQYR